jgi:hypothetical protein
MRLAHVLVTVSTVARDHPAEGPLRPSLPAAIGRRQWLASAVLAVCTALVALAVTAGPNPHQRGPQFLLVGGAMLGGAVNNIGFSRAFSCSSCEPQ